MIPYVNVLVAASRTDHPQDAVASAWLKAALQECAAGASFRPMPDGWLAAAVVQLGDHLVTFDAGFKNLLRREQFTLLSGA